jgi:poly-gamma-glutamate synthesis protein (capsule biosynthesis protein)
MKKILVFLAMVDLVLVGSYLIDNRPKKTANTTTGTFSSPKSIFKEFLKEPTPVKNKIILIATGDVMLGRAINYKSVKDNNFTWMWGKTADMLKNADVALINLESPIVTNCPLTTGGMTFCADPKNIEGLTYAGVDIANLANNHLNNYGQIGVENTLELLKNAGISVSGISEPVYKEINQVKLAFLGYNQFVHLPDIGQEIKQAKGQADFVVVAFHWGEEYTDKPTAKQQELAHLAIDSGADLIIGHHPHWVQPIEVYKDKLIVYSLGNFIFDQGWSEKTKLGEIGQFTFDKNGLTDYQLLPVRIDNSGQPNFK